jgi:HTH DNA binding domain
MQKEIWNEKRKSFPTGGPRKLVVKAIGAQDGDNVLLEVSGLWVAEEERRTPNRSKTFDFFKSLEKLPLYQLKPPTIEGNSIRLYAVAENSEIKQLLEGLKSRGVSFKIVKLDKFEGGADSPLLQLTFQQSRILRLAQTMGYYDIPRKTKTEDIAKILGMDKGTVGDHLRRAEKHVFESLLSS